MPRRRLSIFLFATVDRQGRIDKAVLIATANFDEHEAVPIEHYQVDLPSAEANVLRDRCKTFPAQKVCGLELRAAA
jgi:hypothetical protein